jgi:7-cyano-7-deazaguanine synthase
VLKSKKKYVLILASGGIDSTACISFYKELKFTTECLFVDYGQAAKVEEYKSIRKIANHYKVKLNKISIDSETNHEHGFIKGRNAFLFFAALLKFKRPYGLIASGIHAGTPYYDCSKEFVDQMQILFKNYTQGTIMLGVPFLTFNKREIFDYCISKKAPIELTYSCEKGGKKVCGICDTCKD